jgi:hypothetical protein
VRDNQHLADGTTALFSRPDSLLIEEAASRVIRGAVDSLRDLETHSPLGNNALQTANNTYNVALMQRLLMEI